MFISIIQLKKQVQTVSRNNSDECLGVKWHDIGQVFNGTSCYTTDVPAQHQLNPSTTEQQRCQGAVFPFFPFVEKCDSRTLRTHLTFMP